jgi:hypothetical protein
MHRYHRRWSQTPNLGTWSTEDSCASDLSALVECASDTRHCDLLEESELIDRTGLLSAHLPVAVGHHSACANHLRWLLERL